MTSQASSALKSKVISTVASKMKQQFEREKHPVRCVAEGYVIQDEKLLLQQGFTDDGDINIVK